MLFLKILSRHFISIQPTWGTLVIFGNFQAQNHTLTNTFKVFHSAMYLIR